MIDIFELTILANLFIVCLIAITIKTSILRKKVNTLEKEVEFLEDRELTHAHTMGVMCRLVDIIETQYENDEELIEDLEDLVKEVKYDEKNKQIN